MIYTYNIHYHYIIHLFSFRCEDLEKYAAEQKCKCILLLNKADLTTEYVRKCWAEYFAKEVRFYLNLIDFIIKIIFKD